MLSYSLYHIHSRCGFLSASLWHIINLYGQKFGDVGMTRVLNYRANGTRLNRAVPGIPNHLPCLIAFAIELVELTTSYLKPVIIQAIQKGTSRTTPTHKAIIVTGVQCKLSTLIDNLYLVL